MPPDARIGRVLLVGAGPGPADLMTVRAQHAVQSAEALLYDALVDPEALALAPSACLKLQTGKRAGGASMSQIAINGLMLKLARRGLRVVRLKGGDPSIFGRSGEEVHWLRSHGVEVEIVPGVTAASAAAAQFAFPLTHRGVARRVVLATARVENGALVAEGWSAGVDPEATLAFYMARDTLQAVSNALIAAGRDPRTPALAVEHAGRPCARAIYGDLSTLPTEVEAARCTGPTIVIVGEVAGLAAPAASQAARCSPPSRAHGC